MPKVELNSTLTEIICFTGHELETQADWISATSVVHDSVRSLLTFFLPLLAGPVDELHVHAFPIIGTLSAVLSIGIGIAIVFML